MTALLRQWSAGKDAPDDDSPEKLLYPLEHAYTPAELAFEALKGADAAAAAVLVAAASAADCDLHLALVSIEESGSAEHTGYYGSRRRGWSDEEDEEDFEVGEVHDRSETLSDWRRPDGSQPALGDLPFTEDELCPPDAFEDLEPDEQHFHEATGNEGASFERTYRRAALVLWPRARRLAVLNQAGLAVTLPYLDELTGRWAESGEGLASPLWREAHELSGHMLHTWPRQVGWYPGRTEAPSDTATLLTLLSQLQDTARIDTFLDILAAGASSKGDNAGYRPGRRSLAAGAGRGVDRAPHRQPCRDELKRVRRPVSPECRRAGYRALGGPQPRCHRAGRGLAGRPDTYAGARLLETPPPRGTRLPR